MIVLNEGLLEKVLRGDTRSVSRAISILENDDEGSKELYASLYPHTGNAGVIGITGPPGSGKSTLTDKITQCLREKGHKIGIVAVDPTSPFTGGSILGDRMRMTKHFLDPNVFIRSMGSRGQLGGLSSATSKAVDVFDAAGFDYVIVETVGVGQSEVEVASLADLVILVFVPGLGDDIQAMKAGIMEIGDLFVVNKMDLEGANKTKIELSSTLSLNLNADKVPEIFMTNASTGEGVFEMSECIIESIKASFATGLIEKKRSKKIEKEIDLVLTSEIIGESRLLADYKEMIIQVSKRSVDPISAAKHLFRKIVGRN